MPGPNSITKEEFDQIQAAFFPETDPSGAKRRRITAETVNSFNAALLESEREAFRNELNEIRLEERERRRLKRVEREREADEPLVREGFPFPVEVV